MSWVFEPLHGPSDVPLTEGPVWDGRHLYFTHIRADRIFRFDPETGSVVVWREGTNRTNGLAFDSQGALFGCCSGGRSIVRFDADGSMQVVADRLDGKRLNTPNDLAIDRNGRIWFSDPFNPDGNLPPGAQEELGHRSILRADPQPDGSYRVLRMTEDTIKPNGLLLSPDESVLYVAESGFTAGIVRELRAYPIRADGSLGPFTTLHTWGEDHRGVHRGIDGMCVDVEGNIIACTGWDVSGPGPLLQVFSPQGRTLETHPIPTHMPTNCCFGGRDMSDLYVTSMRGELFRARTTRRGWTR